MLEQTADKRVMHYFSRGRALVAWRDLWIADDSSHQSLQPRIANRLGESQKPLVQLIDVFFGMRQKIDKIDFLGLGPPHLLQRQLRFVAKDFYARLNLYKIIAADVFGDGLEQIPHARFDRPATVSKLKTKIGFAFARVANFFFVYQEKCGDD